MRNKIDIHIEWLRRADDDELSMQAVLQSGAPSTACFLAQQMAEKYLKALLVYKQNDFPKVHDLLDLETRLLKLVPGITTLHDEPNQLNRYYIETRYPGDYPEFTKVEAQSAAEAVLRIKEYVLEQID